MGVVAATDAYIDWEGPNGVVRLSTADYELKGGTIRLKRRPDAPPPASMPVESELPPGVVRGT